MFGRSNKSSKQPLAGEAPSRPSISVSDSRPTPTFSRLSSSPSVVLSANENPSLPPSSAPSHVKQNLGGSVSMMSLNKIANGTQPHISSSSTTSGWKKRWWGAGDKNKNENNLMPPPAIPPKDRRNLLSRKSRDSLRQIDESSFSSAPDSPALEPAESVTMKSSSSSYRLWGRRATISKDSSPAPSLSPAPMPSKVPTLRSAHSTSTTPEPLTPSDGGLPLPRHSTETFRPANLLSSSRKPWSKSVDDLSKILASVTRTQSREEINPVPFPRKSSVAPSDGSQESSALAVTEDLMEHVIEEQEPPRKQILRRKTNSFSGSTLLMNARPIAVVPVKSEHGQEPLRKLSSPPAMMRPSESSPLLGMNTQDFQPSARTRDSELFNATGFELDSKDPRNKTKKNGHGRSSSHYSLLNMPWSNAKGKEKTKPKPEIAPIQTSPPRKESFSLNNSPTTARSSRRTSQIVHRNGFLLHHIARAAHFPSPSMPLSSPRPALHDDYFNQKQDYKNWKPYKVLLRGNKLLFYKPPSEKRAAIASVFPAYVVPSVPSPKLSPSKQTPNKKRRAARAYWGTSKHPGLEVRPPPRCGGNIWLVRIDRATPDALAHELVFTTLNNPLTDEHPDEDVNEYSDFAFVAILGCLLKRTLDQFLRQMAICIERAQNLEQSSERLKWRIEALNQVIQAYFLASCPSEPYDNLVRACQDLVYLPDIKTGTHSQLSNVELIDHFNFDSEPSVIAKSLESVQLAGIATALREPSRALGYLAISTTHPHPVTRQIWLDVLKSRTGQASVRKWLEIGKIARKNGDAATWMVVAHALLHPAITRIKFLWDPSAARTAQAWVASIFCDDGNTLNTPKPSEIPFLGNAFESVIQDSADQPIKISGSFAEAALLLRPVLTRLSSETNTTAGGAGGVSMRMDALDVWTPSFIATRSLAVQPAFTLEPFSIDWEAGRLNPAVIAPLLFVETTRSGSLLHRQAIVASIRPGESLKGMMTAFEDVSNFAAPARRTPTPRQRRSSLPASRRLSVAAFGDKSAESPLKIRGRLTNNEIVLVNLQLSLEVVESSTPFSSSRPSSLLGSLSLARRPSNASKRTSINSTNVSVLEPLRVRVKEASLDRMVDLLLCGVEGLSTTLDADGMELGEEAARRFSLDLADYRRLFFGTFQTFCKPSILFELLRKRWQQAENFKLSEGEDVQLACMDWLLLDHEMTASDGNSANGPRLLVLDVLECWTQGLVPELRDDAVLRELVFGFVAANPQERRLQHWASSLSRLLHSPVITSPAFEQSLQILDLSVASVDEIINGLNAIGVQLSQALSKQILWRSAFIIDSQLVNPLGFHATHAVKSSSVSNIYSHLSQALGINDDRAVFANKMPEAAVRYVRAVQTVSRWVTYQTFVKPQRLHSKADLVRRLLIALATASPQQRSSSPLSGASFVSSLLGVVLVSVESRQSFEVWQEVARVLGVVEISLPALLTACGAHDEATDLASDLGPMILRICELMWAMPNVGVDGQVNFEKRRALRDLIDTAPLEDVVESTTSHVLDALLSRMHTETVRLSGEATKLHDRRVKSVLFMDVLRSEQEKQHRDRIARDALIREYDSSRHLTNLRARELDQLMSKSQLKPARGVQRVTGALRTLHLKHSSSLLSIDAGSDPLERLRKLEFPATKDPAMAIDLIGGKAAAQPNSVRSFVWSLMTELGAIYTFQAANYREMESWTLTINKCSEDGLIQRKTYMPPASIQEVMEPTPSVQILNARNVFGIHISTLMERQGEISDASIPLIADACMNEIERRALSEKGIYRISGTKSKILQLQAQFDDGMKPDLTEEGNYPDPHIVTSVFKLWLRTLPEPVISSHLFSALIKATQIAEYDNRLYAIRALLWLLPPANFILLQRIARHLDMVTFWEADNHMSPQNLSLVFAPNLLRPSEVEGGDSAMMLHLGQATKLVQILITSHQWLFTDHEAEAASTSAPATPRVDETAIDDYNQFITLPNE